ncbi:hypothetical protein chiPu_0017833 [Chiloscyllium punctatum]|uniref:Uncharacterized protein n=1 Tax=Chiloscyllium punctatum TaxID=137246 RepID=A0A401RJ49_CHIPU|nr:hypothetical protein [Chiloscyllium punctatum]
MTHANLPASTPPPFCNGSTGRATYRPQNLTCQACDVKTRRRARAHRCGAAHRTAPARVGVGQLPSAGMCRNSRMET